MPSAEAAARANDKKEDAAIPKGILPDPSKTSATPLTKVVQVTERWSEAPSNSPPVQAIIENVGEYDRTILESHLRPWEWKFVKMFGALDRDGNPEEQAMAALLIYMICNNARTGPKRDDPILFMAKNTEWERFAHFDHLAKGGAETK